VQAKLLNNCRDLLTELGLVSDAHTVLAYPLTGGVASEIAIVKFDDRRLCVKFALPKLKVQADWFAPVHRNSAEYAWLKVVAKVAPGSAVKLLGQSIRLHGFAMEFLEGDDTYLWKTALLSEVAECAQASQVGELIGRVHAASTNPSFDTRPFRNNDDFKAIRLEPYLLHTAIKHNDIAPSLKQLASHLYDSNQVLCHGDVSPKNIFFRDGGPVILDAECATMGDASFDPSFCMNHLILKAIHLPHLQQELLSCALHFWHAYSLFVSWEEVEALESRICRLLPALMLARVDGKSPVEYLSEDGQARVRSMAFPLISSPVTKLDELLDRLGQQIGLVNR